MSVKREMSYPFMAVLSVPGQEAVAQLHQSRAELGRKRLLSRTVPLPR